MQTYLTMAQEVLDKGKDRSDRTGCGTRSIFGYQNRYDLSKGLPLLTTKQVNFEAVVQELLWFIRGETNVRSLQKAGVKIWNQWADEKGELGPVYGYQWRSWPNGKGGYIDQLEQVIANIKATPDSRRLLVNAWNVAQLAEMALPPCHTLFQFYVSDGKLSCQLYQRSGDVFLGVPFNIASYSLLTMMIAQVCDLQPGDFVHTFGDLHIYLNHFEQIKRQLKRQPYSLPQLELNASVKDICAFTRQDIKLINYKHHEKIVGQVAV